MRNYTFKYIIILQALLRLCTLRGTDRCNDRTKCWEVDGEQPANGYDRGTVINIKLRALAHSILNLNYFRNSTAYQ